MGGWIFKAAVVVLIMAGIYHATRPPSTCSADLANMRADRDAWHNIADYWMREAQGRTRWRPAPATRPGIAI